jgi:hypothetical protein
MGMHGQRIKSYIAVLALVSAQQPDIPRENCAHVKIGLAAATPFHSQAVFSKPSASKFKVIRVMKKHLDPHGYTL